MWKMLIADDEPKIRRGLARLISLLELDIEVVGEAEDGMMALEIVKEQSPHLLLVDICMPFLNGLQLIEEVQKVNPDCLDCYHRIRRIFICTTSYQAGSI